MRKDHPQLSAVKAMAPLRLPLTFADGQVLTVDLKRWVNSTRALAALKDAAFFAKAKLGLEGRSVDWVDPKGIELDLGADNLRNLAIEQAGGIGHERIWNWLNDAGLTLEQAAQALGISRRMLIYYRDRENPIPRAVCLACLGWVLCGLKGKGLPRHIPSVREYAALHA